MLSRGNPEVFGLGSDREFWGAIPLATALSCESATARFLAMQSDLNGYLARLLPGHLVDDAYQETFLVVRRRGESFDAGRDFPAWVRGIARNVARQMRQRHGCEHTPLSNAVLTIFAEPPVEAPAFVDVDLHHLRTCFARLEPRHQDLLHRRYEQQQSFAAIAQATGRSSVSVQVALSRLRTALLKCIRRQRCATP